MRNPQALAAGRKAKRHAEKNGASQKEALSAYRRAYITVWIQSPKGKASSKAWHQSPKGKALSKARNQSPKGKAWIQSSASKQSLRKALQEKGALQNGWPDAGRIEQKIGADGVRSEQWRRAANLRSKGIDILLFFAATHEIAVSSKHPKYLSFHCYAEKLGMLEEWEKLVEKEKNSIDRTSL